MDVADKVDARPCTHDPVSYRERTASLLVAKQRCSTSLGASPRADDVAVYRNGEDTMTTHHSQLFLGGEFVDPLGRGTITVTSPSTENVIGSVPEASQDDVDVAVGAARNALDDHEGWSSWAPEVRAKILDRFADEIDARSEDILTAISGQNGMPISLARRLEGGFSSLLLRYYAGLIRDQSEEERRPGMLVRETVVRRGPVGVVAAIVPWNVPQTLTFTKVAPALAAGCAVVVKPSPETVLDAHIVAEAARAAGVPHGVLSFVPGDRDLGAYLVSHPAVDKVAFTGSTEGGRAIAEACARLLRPVSLELGGKSAAIVLDDADLDLDNVGQALFAATLANNGQVCFLGTRVLAPRSRYSEVVDAFAAIVGSATVGDALDENTMIGPMASARQRDRFRATSISGPPRERESSPAAAGPTARGGSSRRRCSPTSTTAPGSHRRRSSDPSCRSSPTTTTEMPSASPTRRPTDSAARCGRPIPSARCPSLGGFTPARSA